MALEIIKRSEFGWPAGPARGSWTPANTNLGMIAHYDGSRRLLADWRKRGHAACVDYWKSCRTAHVNGHGWSDIGYAYFACPDGKILEGRGFGRQQAAEAPERGKMQNGNSRYIAVTFGTGPGEQPEPGQVKAFLELRDHLMSTKGIKGDVFGHQDFTSTDCPGDPVYRMTKNGVLERSAGHATEPQPEEDSMAALPTLHVGDRSVHVLTARALLFERWTSVQWVTDADKDLLFDWLRDERYTPEVKTNIIEFQKAKFPNEPDQWDGIVGPRTWAKLSLTT